MFARRIVWIGVSHNVNAVREEFVDHKTERLLDLPNFCIQAIQQVTRSLSANDGRSHKPSRVTAPAPQTEVRHDSKPGNWLWGGPGVSHKPLKFRHGCRCCDCVGDGMVGWSSTSRLSPSQRRRIRFQIPAIWATICTDLQRCFHLKAPPQTLDRLAGNPLRNLVGPAIPCVRHMAQFHLVVALGAAWNALGHGTTSRHPKDCPMALQREPSLLSCRALLRLRQGPRIR
jgi:hypothetical protein